MCKPKIVKTNGDKRRTCVDYINKHSCKKYEQTQTVDTLVFRHVSAVALWMALLVGPD